MPDKNDGFETAVRRHTEDDLAEFDHVRDGVLNKVHSILHKYPFIVPLIVIILAIIVFGLINPNFYKVNTLSVILQQIGIVGILGAAQAIIVITAGIDLSVGAIAVFTMVLMGQFSFRYGLPAEVSVVLGLACATLMGFINGNLVARLKLPPFIATLGTWQIILAANYIYSRNETVRSQDIESEAPALQFWGELIRIGDARVTYGVLFFLAIVLVMSFILGQTAWGRHVYAVGDDAEAAELAGVNTKTTLIQVYTLAGFLCGLAAWVAIGRFGAISPGASTGMQGNIQSITAVVIGGISLFGGRGSIIGMFLGALVVGVFEMGLRMAGADAQWTFLLIGVLIIAAVAIDQWIRRVSA